MQPVWNRGESGRSSGSRDSVESPAFLPSTPVSMGLGSSGGEPLNHMRPAGGAVGSGRSSSGG